MPWYKYTEKQKEGAQLTQMGVGGAFPRAEDAKCDFWRRKRTWVKGLISKENLKPKGPGRWERTTPLWGWILTKFTTKKKKKKTWSRGLRWATEVSHPRRAVVHLGEPEEFVLYPKDHRVLSLLTWWGG